MNGLDQTAWAAGGNALTSRPGTADSPAQEPGTPAKSRPTFDCQHCGRSFGGYRAFRDAHTSKRCAAVWELRQRGLHKDGQGVWCRPNPTNTQAVLPGITRHVRTNVEPRSASVPSDGRDRYEKAVG